MAQQDPTELHSSAGDMDTLQDREHDNFALTHIYVECNVAMMLNEFATWHADITLR